MIRVRSFLLLLIGALTLVLSLTNEVLLGAIAGREIEKQVGAAMMNAARTLSADLAHILFERHQDIVLLAGHLEDEYAGSTLEMRRELLEHLRAAYPEYSWIGLTDPNGKVLIGTAGMLEGTDVSPRSWFAPSQSNAYLGDVHEAQLLAKLISNADGTPLYLVDVAAPIRNKTDGALLGVLGAHINWHIADSTISAFLGRAPTQSDRETILVLDRSGKVLFGPQEWMWKPLSLPQAPDLLSAARAYRIIDWPDGRSYVTGYAQSAGYKGVPGLGWIVVTRKDVNEAFAPVRNMHRQIALAGGAVGILFLIAGWFGGRAVSAPLGRLADLAEQVAMRRLDQMPVVRSAFRELNVLGNAFASMAVRMREREQALEDANLGLEKRVVERTRDLECAIADLRTARELADNANQAKSRFLSGMSHELRTPMNAILGFSQFLRDNPTETLSAKQAEYIDHILASGRHLLRLIDGVLDLAKVESGRIDMRFEKIGVPFFVDEVLANLGTLAEMRDIQLDADIAEGLPSLRADRTRLLQVVLNLGSNAIKYNRPQGKVILRIAPKDAAHARITVEDTGIGIPTDRHGDLFQPFNRLGADGGPEQGTGIGLVIVHRLVGLMGGTLEFNSREGEGARFWFDLPYWTDANNAEG